MHAIKNTHNILTRGKPYESISGELKVWINYPVDWKDKYTDPTALDANNKKRLHQVAKQNTPPRTVALNTFEK